MLYADACKYLWYPKTNAFERPDYNDGAGVLYIVTEDGHIGIVVADKGMGSYSATLTHDQKTYWDCVFWLNPEKGESIQIDSICRIVNRSIVTYDDDGISESYLELPDNFKRFAA